MRISPEQAATYREQLKTFDLQTPEGRASYDSYRRYIIGISEGYNPNDSKCVTKMCNVYPVKGVKHIGVGFNLERPEARKEWETAFGTGTEAPNFDKVLSGEKKLNKVQVEQLLDSCLATREKQLRGLYRDEWGSLQPNERLAIEHMFYNSPAVGNGRNFKAAIKEYVATEDVTKLDSALYEVLDNSNPKNELGIGFRRVTEATLLDTHGRYQEIIEQRNRDLLAEEVHRQTIRDAERAKKTPKVSTVDIPERVQTLAMQAIETGLGVKIATETEIPQHELANVAKTPAQNITRT